MLQEFIREQVRLVKGCVEHTLGQYDNSSIALLHIDLDLYSGYKHTLETLVPYVVPGGWVVFDEHGEDNWPGATKTVDEFIAANPQWTLQTHTLSGKRYFIKSTY